MTTLTSVASGSFTSAGTARNIILPKPFDYFVVRNRSIWGSNPADAAVESTWSRGYADGQATVLQEANTGVLSAVAVAAGGAGFIEIDESELTVGATVALSGTEITSADPAVATTGTTPFVGDIVRIINSTAMLNIAGLEFTVTAVSLNTNFTMGYLDASGGTFADATGGSYLVIPAARYAPERRWITGITAVATGAVITLSVTHAYSVGDIITVHVPTEFGMTEIDGLQGEISAIDTTNNTVTTDIDSSAFTAFAYPNSATAAAGVSFPHTVPVGEIATSLLNPTDNDSVFGIRLGTAVVGSNTDVMDWIAYSRDYTV